MQAKIIYQSPTHQWIVFARDPSLPDKIIDTNQYMVVSQGEAILLDPGGVELFAPMLPAVLEFVKLEQIRYLFASHQDPDIISSVGFWDKTLQGGKLFAPWLWEGFIRHFGMERIDYVSIPDEGMSLTVGAVTLRFVPAHYLHASGNFHVYDPQARILFTGDVGAALDAPDAPLFVEDFAEQIPKMKKFHQRWMPSNQAKNDWIARVRSLDIDMLLPQHGRIFKGEHVTAFLDWFAALEVGIARN